MVSRRGISLIYERLSTGFDVPTPTWRHLTEYDVILTTSDNTGNSTFLHRTVTRIDVLSRWRRPKVDYIEKFQVGCNTGNNLKTRYLEHLWRMSTGFDVPTSASRHLTDYDVIMTTSDNTGNSLIRRRRRATIPERYRWSISKIPLEWNLRCQHIGVPT